MADDEEVEFKADKSNKGWEAVEVRGCEGSDCRGSHRRPGAKKKLKKVRSVKSISQVISWHVNIYSPCVIKLPMDHATARQNEIQGRIVVFLKAYVYSISFCLTAALIIINPVIILLTH